MDLLIRTSIDVGAAVHDERRRRGLTQEELAGLCGVGPRFILELEKGKPTAELGKALHVLGMLGLVLRAERRGTT